MNDVSRTDETDTMTVPSRRSFLRTSAAALGVPAAASLLAACSTGADAAPGSDTAQGAGGHGSDHGGGPPAATASPAPAAKDWREMDRKHEAGVRSFPAPTGRHGNQPLQPRLRNGAKEFELVCSNVQWEVEPGKYVPAMAFNGMVPGPVIRVTEGDRVRVTVATNSTSPPRSTGTARTS
jgi:manganese oxidase